MKKSVIKLWGMPFLTGVLLLSGLIIALIGNGIWDVSACVLLIVPVLMIVRKYFHS